MKLAIGLSFSLSYNIRERSKSTPSSSKVPLLKYSNGKEKKGEFIDGAFQKEPKLRELIETDANSKRVWEFAKKLEGLKRNSGIHAAGLPERPLDPDCLGDG